VLLLEAGAVTDNPVLMPETGDVVTGGHFHGQPLALQLDALYAACAEVANIAERRVNLMLSGNGGRLPRFLAADPGLESGLMIAQYLAAALVVETRNKAFPAAVDSIPTSDGQEDHVSMGSISALKLAGCLDRCEAVVALELLSAGRALAFITREDHARRLGRRPMQPADSLQLVLDRLGVAVDMSPGDRPLTHDLLAGVINEFNGEVHRIVITHAKENVFYATIMIEKDGSLVEIDARPSDSLVMALKFEAPVFVSKTLFENMSLPMEDKAEIEDEYGLALQELTPELSEYLSFAPKQGVMISGIRKGSRAAEDGLEPGDIIVAIGGQVIEDVLSIKKVVAETKAPVKAEIFRNSRSMTFTLHLP